MIAASRLLTARPGVITAGELNRYAAPITTLLPMTPNNSPKDIATMIVNDADTPNAAVRTVQNVASSLKSQGASLKAIYEFYNSLLDALDHRLIGFENMPQGDPQVVNTVAKLRAAEDQTRSILESLLNELRETQ